MSRQTADDLREALAAIEDSDHWVKGSECEPQFNERGGMVHAAFCSTGAAQVGTGFLTTMGYTAETWAEIYKTPGEHQARVVRYSAVVLALAKVINPDCPIGGEGVAVVSFNDHQDTTHEMVVSMFKDAIIAEEAAE